MFLFLYWGLRYLGLKFYSNGSGTRASGSRIPTSCIKQLSMLESSLEILVVPAKGSMPVLRFQGALNPKR